MPWAEEVLVGRGDINEKRERMAELEAQVRVWSVICFWEWEKEGRSESGWGYHGKAEAIGWAGGAGGGSVVVHCGLAGQRQSQQRSSETQHALN